MDPQLEQIISMIQNTNLRKKIRDMVNKPSIKIKGFRKIGLPLDKSPAGKSKHHSYDKGLVDHVVATSRTALALCDVVEKVYHCKVNRDLVISGVLLHDLMKPLTYTKQDNGTYGISSLGEKLDHLSLVVAEGYRRKLPIELLHIICAHHGRAGPISPHTIEALICHVADVADATLNGEVFNAARWLVRDCVGEDVTTLTAEEAYTIVQAKQTQGCEGVREAFKKIKKKHSGGFESY
jgi:7,8-dihydroneopterin 2',3'-cyclic phosphate phosphodiesterase